MSRKRRPLLEILRRIYGEDGYDAEANAKGCYDLAISTMRAKLESYRCERIGEHRLYLGNCAEIVPLLPTGVAIVSDPPYGMAWNTDSTRFTGGQHKRGDGRADWGEIAQDAQPFDPAPWLEFDECILWGANHYAQKLPIGTTLVWIKKAPHLFGTFLSDAEMGWQAGGYGVYVHFEQFPPPSRMFENDGAEVAHPTQKPIGLMRWCVERTRAKTILDPFMGSGTTGVACAKLGRRFIGIEIDPTHFETSCRRITEAMNQPDMFVTPPAPEAEQLALPEAL